MNGVDNCPMVINEDQLDGDRDNVGDVCDVCPDTEFGWAADESGCAANERDSDNDGSVECEDDGSTWVGSNTLLGYGDCDDNSSSYNQNDIDGDGYSNDEDNCPLQANDQTDSDSVPGPTSHHQTDQKMFKHQLGVVGPPNVLFQGQQSNI